MSVVIKIKGVLDVCQPLAQRLAAAVQALGDPVAEEHSGHLARSGGQSSALQNGSATYLPLCKGLTHGKTSNTRGIEARCELRVPGGRGACTHSASPRSGRASPDARPSAESDPGMGCNEGWTESSWRIAEGTYRASIRATCAASYRQLISFRQWRKRMRSMVDPGPLRFCLTCPIQATCPSASSSSHADGSGAPADPTRWPQTCDQSLGRSSQSLTLRSSSQIRWQCLTGTGRCFG